MDPSDKKWFKSFVDNITSRFDQKSEILIRLFKKYTTEDDFIHFYIHSTGLFYGYVSRHLLCKFPSSKTWSYADHYKISLTEGLFIAYLYHQKSRFFITQNYTELLQEALKKIYEFYVIYTIDESYFKKKKSFFNRLENSEYITIEKLINHRVNNPSLLQKGFWKGSHYNVFSYLDILYFSRWLAGDYLHDKKHVIKHTILQTMIAAIHTVDEPTKSDKKLVSYFITSANIGKEIEKSLHDDISNKLTINDITYENQYSKIIAHIIFENAVVTLLGDSEIDEIEELFLTKLALKLGITQDEVQYSSVLVENFISHNTKHILYMQEHKTSIDLITKSFTLRFQTFLNKNSSKIITEISESKELMELLWKSKNEKLSDEEREKVKEQIIDILRTIPSLTIFMIPGGSLLLPLLIKILPEELFVPSSFRNK